MHASVCYGLAECNSSTHQESCDTSEDDAAITAQDTFTRFLFAVDPEEKFHGLASQNLGAVLDNYLR
jgi:hypothetical protein